MNQREKLNLVKAHNPLFFDRKTMRFFGKQKVTIDNDKLRVQYLEKCPRICWWLINPFTYELTPIVK